MNYKMMGKFLSQILFLEAGLMLPALFICIAEQTKKAGAAFAASIGITVAVALALYIICRKAEKRFYAREGMVCVGICWMAMSILGCLPFFLSGEIPNYLDALFEIVSGFTTTGATILKDVEAMSDGMLYWRSFSHWLGGMGVLVFVLARRKSGSRCRQTGTKDAYHGKNPLHDLYSADRIKLYVFNAWGHAVF